MTFFSCYVCASQDSVEVGQFLEKWWK